MAKKKITKKKTVKKGPVKRVAKRRVTEKVLGNKEEFVGFRCNKLLAGLLKTVENKTEFVTGALYEKFKSEGFLTKCPTCEGAGRISPIRVVKKSLKKRK